MTNTLVVKSLTYFIFCSIMLSACLKQNGTHVIAPPDNGISDYAKADSSDYKLIDSHALNAPKKVEGSIQSLATYLTAPATNDREKARAIYRWITHNIAYDDTSYFSGNFKVMNKEDAFKTRRAVCDGYAGLFKRLGEAAGLEVEDISGYSKGYSYTVAQTDTINHAWNAVKIDGQWQLLDSTWGAGYLDDKKKRFIRQFQPHYFLTPPDQFIYDHFPRESKWQLLRLPVPKSQYDQWVYLRPAFFQNGLAIDSHPQGMIHTNNQEKISLRRSAKAIISAKLLHNNTPVDQSHVSIQQKSEQYLIATTFPQPGQYILRIFVKQDTDPGAYRWALDYRIVAKQGMAANLVPVSPDQAFLDAGLKVDSHPQRLIETQKQVKVTIQAPDDALMSAKLYNNNKRLDKSLTLVQKQAGVYEIHAVFPRRGDYLMRLFAKRISSGGEYEQALDYDVKVSQGMSGKIGFPSTYAPFKENGGYLYSPMARHLAVGTTQHFKLKVPNAQNLVVVTGDNKFPLKKQGDVFEGKVKMSSGKMTVYAQFPGERRYSSLLQYIAE
jgi:transglutaminase/protease-like cytokinesis protein 3